MTMNIFTCGPFADAAKNIELFGTSLYFAQIYHKAMMEHEQLEIELKAAREKNEDASVVKYIEEQISFIENACKLPLCVDPEELSN